MIKSSKSKLSDLERIRYEQTSGHQISNILCPSDSVREDIRRKGKIPKNHSKQNKLNLKNLETQVKYKKSLENLKKPEPFKLKKFENVKPKVDSMNEFYTQFDNLGKEMDVVDPENGEPNNIKIKSRSSTLNSTISNDSAKSLGSRSNSSMKNFININTANVIKLNNELRNSRNSTPDLSKTKNHNFGEVPKYLVDRKLEWAKQEEERLLEIERQKIPKGMKLLDELERLKTLENLKKSKEIELSKLNKLPFHIETQSKKNYKKSIELNLKEIELGIEIFSKPKVYVEE